MQIVLESSISQNGNKAFGCTLKWYLRWAKWNSFNSFYCCDYCHCLSIHEILPSFFSIQTQKEFAFILAQCDLGCSVCISSGPAPNICVSGEHFEQAQRGLHTAFPAVAIEPMERISGCMNCFYALIPRISDVGAKVSTYTTRSVQTQLSWQFPCGQLMPRRC